MNKTKYILLLKCFYYLTPRFFREQYSDSARFYNDLFKKIQNKYYRQQYSYYILVDEIKELKNNFNILFEMDNRKSKTNEIIIYEKNKKKYKLPSITNDVLDIKIGIFNEVTIIGCTDALVYDDYLYHQELLAMDEYHDLKRWDIFVDFSKKDKNTISLNNSSSSIFNAKSTMYITLLKEHSLNYYHWITENIPRLILILEVLSKDDSMIKNNKITVLIDQGMPIQCKEVIDLIMPFEYAIVEVSKGKRCICNNLLYCSPLWQSLDNTSRKLNHSEFFVDKYALELVYRTIRKNTLLDKKPPTRKIYLRRKPSQMRSILNNDKVEKYMRLNDFEMVDTAKMSFVEQVKLFHEAKLVVGASGATFTNILFMQVKTKAIIFFPSHPSVNHGIFQPLADVANVNLVHYKTIPQDYESIHSNFMVDLDKIDFLLGESIGL
ncbi:MAG: glycosyltransferase family 61 protein [Sulfurimonas sp.]|nr:glycosyltransferase family 61 protein [Sulfurimonas sp.]